MTRLRELQLPWTTQPPGAPVLHPRFAARVGFMQVGGWIYDGISWSRFSETAQQKIGVGLAGAGIVTTADSTPEILPVNGVVSLTDFAVVFVGRKNVDTLYDSSFNFREPAGISIWFNTWNGLGIDTGYLGVSGTSGIYQPTNTKYAKSGAVVWRNCAAEGVGNLHTDGKITASGTVPSAINRYFADSTLGGGYSSTANWRGTSELTVLLSYVSTPEAAAISANPWGELFAPRRIFVPMSSGAPTLPTLSAATYMPGSITSSGFRPRVTAS